MKRLIALLTLILALSASVFAVDLDGGTWSYYRHDGGDSPGYMQDNNGNIYVYGDETGTIGLRYMNYGAFVGSGDGWLINGNPGDTLNVSYTVSGISDRYAQYGYGTGYYEANKEFELGRMSIYLDGDAFRFNDFTQTVENVDGTNVITFNFTYELPEAYEYLEGADLATSFKLESLTWNDGTVKYHNEPAFLVSVPTIELVRKTPDPEEETVLPEPCTIAYAIMGFGSLMGMKKRFGK